MRHERPGLDITSLNVAARPLRVAFIINKKQWSTLQRCIGLNTAIWGGFQNPILFLKGVHDDREVRQIESILEQFRVDSIHPDFPEEEARTLFLKLPAYRWPSGMVRSGLFESTGAEKDLSLPTVEWVLDEAWQQSFQHGSRSNCVLPSTSRKGYLARLLAVQCGLPSRGLAKAHRSRMQAVDVKIESPEELSGLVGRHWPIDATRSDLLPDDVGLMQRAHIAFFGSSSSMSGCIDFWNIRAARGFAHFLPRESPVATAAICGSIATNIVKRGRTGAGAQVSVVHVLMRKRDVSAWEAVARTLPSIKEVVFLREVLPNSRQTYPKLMPSRFETLSKEASVAVASNQEPSYRVSVSLPSFGVDSAEPRGHKDVTLAYSVSSYGVVGQNRYTLRLPMRPHRDWRESYGWPLGDKVSASDRGLTVAPHFARQQLNLTLLPTRQVFSDWFKSFGIGTVVERPGRVFDRILGQNNGLLGASLYQRPGVREVLRVAALGSPLPAARITQTIRDHDREAIRKGQLSDLGTAPDNERLKALADQAFAELVRRDVLTAGLNVVCKHCGLRAFAPLAAIDDEIECDHCGRAFELGLAIQEQWPKWHFRLRGVFAKDGNPEGVIPVYLAAARLFGFDAIQNSDFVGPTICKWDGETVEADLMAYENLRSGQTNILVGECKAYQRLEKEQLDRLFSLATRIQRHGVSVYILVAKLSDGFDSTERSLLKRLHRRGAKVVALCQDEIDNGPNWSKKREAVAGYDSYPHGFEAWHKNTRLVLLS